MFLLYVSVITIVPFVFNYKVTCFYVKKNNIDVSFYVIIFLLWKILCVTIIQFDLLDNLCRKQKEIRNFQKSLQAGDHVVTGGGIYGTGKNINLEKNTVEV